jgi:cytochrome b561
MQHDANLYTWQAMVLHWLLAVLIFALIGLGWYIGGLPRGSTLKPLLLGLHESCGMLAGILVLVRLWWRALNQPPSLPATVPDWQQKAAQVGHALLYLCIVIMPLTGYATANFVKDPLLFFGYPVPQWGWSSRPLEKLFADIHSATSNVLVALLVAHIAVALKHWFIDKDGVFQRMLPRKPPQRA